MTSSRHIHALALAALVAAPALAGDVTLGGRTELWYDSNVTGSESGTVSDGELLVSPKLGLSDRWGTVDASLDLKPTYELFFNEASLRGWNYQADGKLVWAPSPRTHVALLDSFTRDRNLRLLTVTPSGGTPAEFGARDRFSRNLVQLSAQHRLTPIDTLSFASGYVLWRFSDGRRTDQDTYSSSLRFEHSLTRTISIGGSTSWSRVSLEKIAGIPRRNTDYFNLSLVANYAPVDTFVVRASAGPTYVRQPKSKLPKLVRADRYLFSGNSIRVGFTPTTCPTLPNNEIYYSSACNASFISVGPGSIVFNQLVLRAFDPIPLLGLTSDPHDLTYFADLSIERNWNIGSLSIGYNRDEGSNSTVGFSSVADVLELRASYQPLRELSLNGAVIWEDRKETQSGASYLTILDTVPGAGPLPAIGNLVPVAVRAVDSGAFAESVRSITTYFAAQYRVSKRARVDATFQWRKQNATSDVFFNDYERFQIMLALDVELEPFRW